MIVPKFPNTGTTIFSVMSAWAQQHKAINLSQGFPDFSIAPALANLVTEALYEGYNQYAPMTGLPSLRVAIAQKINHFQQVVIDPETEITITPGATYAIYTALTTLLQKGDEVLVLEPAYDSYIPNIYMNGGIPVGIALDDQDFSIPWDKVAAAVNKRTKAIIINNPHNPSGKVWTRDDFQQLITIVEKHNLYVVADEVYEHLVFDGHQHISVLQFPELRQRSFVVYSFGKVYHATGWKTGYCVAPPELSSSFRQIHQYLAFSVNTTVQQALALYLQDVQPILESGTLLQGKRDFFLQEMKDSALHLRQPAQGSYFQLMNYEGISDLPDKAFALWLTEQYGVAAIPLSPFFSTDYSGKWLRFCFAKQEATLQEAAQRLRKL